MNYKKRKLSHVLHVMLCDAIEFRDAMHECNALNTCQGLTSDIKHPPQWKHLVVNRAKAQPSTVSHKSFQFPLKIT